MRVAHFFVTLSPEIGRHVAGIMLDRW